MKTRLKRELYDFLIKERISLETDIVNELIYQMAGVTLPKTDEDHSTPGFSLSRSWDKNEDLKFDLPKLALPELFKLLDFFQIPRDKYVTNDSLTLDSDFVFKVLLPEFKKHFQAVKESNPSVIARYIVKSKPILESSAITTLKEYTSKALGTLLDSKATDFSPNTETMMNSLSALHFKTDHLSKWPNLYKSVIATADQVKSYSSFPEVTQKSELQKQLKLIVEGIDLFERYNRCESALANEAVAKELEAFLNEKQISSTLCDVIEEALLSLAGAKLGANGKCHTEQGYDTSRRVFAFTDIDKENTAKVIDYLQKAGDDTATEGFGSRHYGSSIPESAVMACSMDMPMSKSIGRREMLERHSIETDGKFFREVIVPRLKAVIDSLDKAKLDEYREKSKPYFAKKDKVVDSNRLFKPVICPEPVSGDESTEDDDLTAVAPGLK